MPEVVMSNPGSIPPNVDGFITSVPFAVDHNGKFVDSVPAESQITFLSSFNTIRERFELSGLLSDEELSALQNHVVGFMKSAVSSAVPNYGESEGVFDKYNSVALFQSNLDAKTGTGEVQVLQDPSLNGDILQIDLHRLDAEAEAMRNNPSIEWKTQADARLINYFSAFSHEQSHSLARQFAKDMNPLGKFSNSFFAAFLSTHPAEGYTGLLGSDPNIHDERFANGVASITVKYIMSSLGYSENEQDTVLGMCMPLDQEYSEGAHHHVEAAEHARQVQSTVGRAALELAGYPSDHLSYEGGLGYKKPLTPEEIGDVLFFAHEITREQNPVTATILDPDAYRSYFDAQYNGKMHPDVEARLGQVRQTKTL
jgi:hypothetical protein